MFIETATGNKWNPPGPEIVGSAVVVRRGRTFIDREDLAVRTRIKHVAAGAGEQRNVRTESRALDAGQIAHRGERLFGETRSRAEIRIARVGQGDEPEPDIVRVISDVLLTQAHEAGDEQGRAGEQRDGKRDLRADQDFAEPQL